MWCCVADSLQPEWVESGYKRDVNATAIEQTSATAQTTVPEARFWDKIAEKYSKKPVADPAAYQRKLDFTKARLKPHHVVLDIGCGTGSLALELAPRVSHVHAVDVSSEMVRIANRKAAAARVSNVTFYKTSIEEEESFGRESFDVICAYNILHLVQDHQDTLGKLFGLLKPGGHFISSTACLRETWVPFGLIIPLMQLVGRAPHVLMLRGRAARGRDARGRVHRRRAKASQRQQDDDVRPRPQARRGSFYRRLGHRRSGRL